MPHVDIYATSLEKTDPNIIRFLVEYGPLSLAPPMGDLDPADVRLVVQWKGPFETWEDDARTKNYDSLSPSGGIGNLAHDFYDLGTSFQARARLVSITDDPAFPVFPWHEESYAYTPPIQTSVTLDLANIALGHLGTASLADYNETSPEGVHIRRHWNLVRDSLLRQRHWNFAIKRVELELAGLVEMTGGSVTRGDETVTVASTTGLSVGQTVIGSGIPAGTKVASVTDGTHFEMDAAATTTGSSLAISAYDAPAFDYQFAYVLPTDYLRALNLNNREAGTSEAGYDIELGLLLTDDESAQLLYVAKVTDPSSWDDSFKEAFCLRLAARVATGITTAQGLAAQLDQRAEQYLQKAFGPDNGETKPRAVLAQNNSGWLDARNGFDSRFG